MKKALITGITGQDGSYLTEFLYEKGYDVHGIIRRSSTSNTGRIDHIIEDLHTKDSRIHLHYGDLADSGNLSRLIEKIEPDEIYNLGAQSHVRVSFDMPEYTAQVVGIGTLALLDAARNLSSKVKFYQAGTSEMFGKVSEVPQKETTPFYPRSPYGCAKVFAHHSVVNYRESYNMFACNGILFNHESPRREATFVTRKVIRGIKEIVAGKIEKICLGNLDSKRDWGYAPEYVEAMWLMLQQEVPDDYVIATGETHSVRELVEVTAELVGIKIEWRGEGASEVGVDSATGKTIVEIDPYYFRPAEVDLLLGDPTKAQQKLGWFAKTSFRELIKIIFDAEKI
jgi:GDPmannose 4,6-dehydratase